MKAPFKNQFFQNQFNDDYIDDIDPVDIEHISYKKFIAIVREKNIPFGYIGSINIGSVVAQIYGEMV